MTRHNHIDLWKFIMAIAVVAIHTRPLINLKGSIVLDFFNLFISMAVPFFFMTSGYLLWSRIDGFSADEKNSVLCVRAKSVGKMYAIWTLIYFPLALMPYMMVNVQEYEKISPLKFIIYYVRGVILRGQNYNSYPLWYLLSLFYIILLLIALEKLHLSDKWILSILIIVGIIGNIINGLVQIETSNTLLLMIKKAVTVTVLDGRILSGALYIAVGIIVAKRRKIHLESSIIINTIYGLGVIIGFIANLRINNTWGSMILTIYSSVCFFSVIEGINISNNNIYAKLRSISTTMYLTHMYVWTIFYMIVYGDKTFGMESFAATVVGTLLIGIAFLMVQNKKFHQRDLKDNNKRNMEGS